MGLLEMSHGKLRAHVAIASAHNLFSCSDPMNILSRCGITSSSSTIRWLTLISLQISQTFSRCNFSLPTYETWIHMPYRSCLESLCLKRIADFKQEQKQRDNDSFECRLSCCPTSYIQNLWCKMRIAGLFVSLQRSMPITGYNNLFHQFL